MEAPEIVFRVQGKHLLTQTYDPQYENDLRITWEHVPDVEIIEYIRADLVAAKDAEAGEVRKMVTRYIREYTTEVPDFALRKMYRDDLIALVDKWDRAALNGGDTDTKKED